ncbi:MAG: GNAT family N-acetyltransferase [Chloroflexota bacterium]|jgi:GNAT superfamily N-acetyltransferase|nr:GNAT family N-acetyltransferase [Aggregatilineaceae bacterium]
MAEPVSVRLVESKADFKTFLEFPWTLYKGARHWVPPLVSMQKHKLDRQHNATWKHMQGDYFVAWRGDRPVGTIAAFINHRHNEFHHEHIGFFGTFEVYDDQEAASALLNTAADYVAKLGYDAIRGPASFSTNDECGVLIEGFDDPPVVLMPYNYPYYARLVEGTPGFEKVMDLYSYYITLEGIHEAKERLEKLFRVTRKNNERRGITVRPIDRHNLAQEFELLRSIYNRAWERNWGFVPASDEELDELVKALGQYFDPRLAFFAHVDGEPVAFILALPDMNQPLHRAYARPGKPEPITLLQVLWHWKLRPKITRIRIMLMGVREGFRGIGVEAAMFAEMYQAASRMGWQYADGGWVLETNTAMERLVHAHNGRPYKRYRFYQRELKAPAAAE